MNPTPLLLAPAGSREAGGAALQAGADAVYVGLRGWSRGGARRELDWSELAAARREVASAGRNLRVAINTIPRPRERARLLDCAAALLDLGIEDVIVNDIGTLAGLRRRLPDLKLTASVGCGARTTEDVAFLRDAGADSVVLPATVGPAEAREIAAVRGISVEIMIHMVEEFILLGKCWMPSSMHLKPTPFPALAPLARSIPDDPPTLRQTGSMKRGGVGACFRICQQPWELFADGRPVDERLLPGRQISRIAEVRAYADAGVRVLKLQGRSLPIELLTPLVRRYREAIDSEAVWLPKGAPPAALPEMWTVVGR